MPTKRSSAHIEIRETDTDWGDATPPPMVERPHYLLLVASNGEPLAHSENYPTPDGAREGEAAWLRAFSQIVSALLLEVTA